MVVKRRVKLLPVAFKDENAIRLIYEGEEIKPNERFLPKYNEVIHLIGVRRIAESGLQFEDFPICGLRSITNGNGSYTIDGYKVQTPSGGRRVEILQILKEGLGLDLEIIFPDKVSASDSKSLKSSFSVDYQETTYQEKDDKSTVMKVMRQIGIDRIKAECVGTKITINNKEYPLISNIKEGYTHYLEFEDEGCYVACSRHDRKQVLVAIEETMHLGLIIHDLKDKEY